MSQIVNVLLTTIGEEDVLIFKLNDEVTPEYIIELNSDSSQSQIKKVFSKLLEKLFEVDIELHYSCATGYSKGLYKDVCEEYIKDLNAEIAIIRSEIQSEFK